MEGNVALFEQSEEKRTRDTKNLSRTVGREFLMIRADGNCPTGLKIFQDREQ